MAVRGDRDLSASLTKPVPADKRVAARSRAAEIPSGPPPSTPDFPACRYLTPCRRMNIVTSANVIPNFSIVERLMIVSASKAQIQSSKLTR